MKKHLLTFGMIMIALSLMFTVNSCKKDTPVEPQTDLMMTTQVIPQDVIPAFDAENVTVYSTIESDIKCYPDFVTPDVSATAINDRMGPAFKLAAIFKRMNLTDRQLAAIRPFLVGYQECVKSVMLRTEAQKQAAIRRAAAARADVIAGYKNGEYDRATAARKIEVINKALKESLDKLVDRTALCDCLKALYRKIRTILTTDEQKAMWDKWVASQKLPCMSVDTTP